MVAPLLIGGLLAAGGVVSGLFLGGEKRQEQSRETRTEQTRQPIIEKKTTQTFSRITQDDQTYAPTLLIGSPGASASPYIKKSQSAEAPEVSAPSQFTPSVIRPENRTETREEASAIKSLGKNAVLLGAAGIALFFLVGDD